MSPNQITATGRSLCDTDNLTHPIATVTLENVHTANLMAAVMASRWNALAGISEADLHQIAERFPNDQDARRRMLIDLLKESLE